MEIIKFRITYIRNDEIVQKVYKLIDGKINYTREWENNGFEVLGQDLYTGAKDRVGKEIYAGDIIEGPSDSRPYMGPHSKTNKRTTARFEVKYSEFDWGHFYLKEICGVQRTYPSSAESEVIGNIYEHPELVITTK